MIQEKKKNKNKRKLMNIKKKDARLTKEETPLANFLRIGFKDWSKLDTILTLNT